ncbi:MULTISPECIES: S41 family peptidase [Thiorhodovibrio]|uniref:S41 family peptidase n=1 Tax=Thiorhodovibrio TaxID=61593 RepID=UPI0019139ABC|nr:MULTISPECIES: S41 family peptidase [Thiorhodovibrio]MBK5971067.1 peptidase [Thiorhodovibrio winogradskyi]
MLKLSFPANRMPCSGSVSETVRQRASSAVIAAPALVAAACLLSLTTLAVSAEPPKPYTPAPDVEPLTQPAAQPAESAPAPAENKAEPDSHAQDTAGDQGEDQGEADAAETAAEKEDESALPLEQLRSFAEVFGRIKSDYVEPVDDKALLKAAIRGMLSGLDPHSSYLDAEEYEDLQVGTKGEFGGLGIEVGMEDGFVKVIAPIDDTPAERAGVQAGDVVVRIDDKPVKGMSLGDAVKLMRGEPGTGIELTIMRDGEDKPLKIAIERDIIQVASVKGRMLEPGYAYIRVSNFQSRTTEDMRRKIEELRLKAKQPADTAESAAAPSETEQDQDLTESDSETSAAATGDPIKGLVLDLRNNPGGVLNSAVGVSDAFLRGGLIVYTQGRVEDARMEFKAGPDDILEDAPLVVLVNGGSASASEIVAGALQDQGRAIIMGTDTFGKGSVQTIVPVDETTALKLTTARYYTPSGRSIQAHGIEPDIGLERGSLTLADKPDVAPLKEANLVRHLEDDAADENAADETDAEQSLAAKDYQLSEALNVLKALSLARTRTSFKPEILVPPQSN